MHRFKYALFDTSGEPVASTTVCAVHFSDDMIAAGFAEVPDGTAFRQVTFDDSLACRVCGYVGGPADAPAPAPSVASFPTDGNAR